MLLVLLSLIILVLSSAVALCLGRVPSRAQDAGAYGAAAASLAGLFPALRTLLTGNTETVSFPWSVPLGSLTFTLDPLAAFFLVPLFILTGLSAVYGVDYLKGYAGKKPLGLAWGAFNTLTAAMVLVFTAGNAVLFMLGWELMAAASFLLVLFEHEKPQVRRAAFIYLTAGGAGALMLLAAFSLLGAGSAVLDFSSFPSPSRGIASAVFLLALCGFGFKAGFVPLHIWLPEAHPAAPSQVSAVMSGIMIKTGIYGIIRVLGFIKPWEEWWGWTLLIIGAVSCLLGALFALAQHELKRVLAYSSIENIGIILMALGLGMVGVVCGADTLAGLAFAGALLHVMNHSLFKGLLFMGAGSVLHAAGTAELEALGGLAKRMPRTAPLFLAGSAAACALPPFNGFAGEFLVYLGAFRSLNSTGSIALAGMVSGLVLASAGALAAAAFTRAGGTAFLGEPRTARAAAAHEAGPLMIFAMRALALLCLLGGLAGPFLLLPLGTAVASGFGLNFALAATEAATVPFAYVSAGGLILLAMIAIAAAKRRAFLGGKKPAEGVTWDCGYAAPSARMQYGASSFSQPLTDFFQPILRKLGQYPVISEYFPGRASFSTETQAVLYNSLYMPVAVRIRDLAFRFSWLQHGRLQIYIMYIVVTLMGLLLWKL
ncbi:MAG: proton-conducting transporter membrane subunit [Elusimicrobiota bacterium]|nr:proton-conducting transporter membrane subunit [Elusimicrobiota bacterium]